MAEIRDQGAQPTYMEQYLLDLQTIFQDAFGANLDTAPETPQGQVIDSLSLKFARVDQEVISVANGASPYTANNQQLDDLLSWLAFRREGSTAAENRESNEQFFARYRRQAFRHAQATESAIRARINEVAAVRKAEVIHNRRANAITSRGVTVPSRSLWIIVLGGDPEDIGSAIATTAAPGPLFFGGPPASYTGTANIGTVAVLKRIVAGTLTTDGVDVTLDFSVITATDELPVRNAAASIIQTALRGTSDTRLDGVTVAYNGAQFVVTLEDVDRGEFEREFTGTAARALGLDEAEAWWPVRHRHDGGSVESVRFARPESIPVSVNLTIVADETFPGDGHTRVIEALVAEVASWDIGQSANRFDLGDAALTVPGHRVATLTVSPATGSGPVDRWQVPVASFLTGGLSTLQGLHEIGNTGTTGLLYDGAPVTLVVPNARYHGTEQVASLTASTYNGSSSIANVATLKSRGATNTLTFEGVSFTADFSGIVSTVEAEVRTACANIMQRSLRLAAAAYGPAVEALTRAQVSYDITSRVFRVHLPAGDIAGHLGGTNASDLGLEAGTHFGTTAYTAANLSFEGFLFTVDFSTAATIDNLATLTQVALRAAIAADARLTGVTVVREGGALSVQLAVPGAISVGIEGSEAHLLGFRPLRDTVLSPSPEEVATVIQTALRETAINSADPATHIFTDVVVGFTTVPDAVGPGGALRLRIDASDATVTNASSTSRSLGYFTTDAGWTPGATLGWANPSSAMGLTQVAGGVIGPSGGIVLRGIGAEDIVTLAVEQVTLTVQQATI